ncbi:MULTISPECIES: DEAD/DEAH box helicase [unclassified Imperialibacter]|uniref:DEAD/DEAH box helicase n=1 Tax=unclassified Imperialibacter TaxID=2629706 RepID=UPI0012558938|nr:MULTISPECIES: DEAD/DEAH box helicase [unclassified Imperialibacter]CAD5262816.1 DNA/RNA helicase [Imperialibacter sp. 75]CAD5275754.1 DNA/RNA helicase [Imperialibacter sp. 89]VVT08426.1 DNA/RNA helicase [Imperialibacter sp. EC-SDR9]
MEKKPDENKVATSSKPFEDFKGESRPGGVALDKYLSAEQSGTGETSGSKTIVVLGSHRYYNLFSAQLVRGGLTQNRELKNPLTVLNPLDSMWQSQNPEVLRFYAAIARFQAFYEPTLTDLEAIRAIVSNPLHYSFYQHDASVSEKVSAKSVSKIALREADVRVLVRISMENDVYHVRAEVYIEGAFTPAARVAVRFDRFVTIDEQWLMAEKTDALKVLSYFRKYEDGLRLPHGEFVRFQKDVLSQMENHVEVVHEYMETARATTEDESQSTRLIYLSDFGDYIVIDPVVRYGKTEIPVLTTKQIYIEDLKGEPAMLERDTEMEEAFLSRLIRQHPHFKEQVNNPLLYFYIHKTRFVQNGWFLKAYEEWKAEGLEVLGFSQLKGIDVNPEPVNISIQVSSGLNWFNARIEAKFGRKKASLKQIHKAVKNQNRYVTLGDGTLGVIPEEWLQKFEGYFAAGTIVDDVVQVPKINFESVNQLFERFMLDEETQQEVSGYRQKLSSIGKITPAKPSTALKATLRPYQLQGLTWLNVLDEFNFGGCLADDMGLGKTIQIIAFILALKEKHGSSTHILVAPTSVIHNWHNEIERFAPTLKTVSFHGPHRLRIIPKFKDYDLVITTYHTLVNDITYLRKYQFHYAFLDESHNIKNLASQRNKAARMLKSKNRVILTGTPLENHSFDLYAQLSFACPGLLGSRTYFRNTYAMAIDKFQHKHSILDLQQRISPFILRRTKKEVATELPEKTEMVLYCDMEAEQRKTYDAREKELRDLIESTNNEQLLKTPMYALRGITQLRQICNSPLLLGEEKEYGDSSAKIDTLMEQLRNITGDHKVLVFSQFVSMLNLIEKELAKEHIGYTMLTGSTTNREEVVSQFQNDVHARVFLISLKAGGTGLNLTEADYVFLVDPWWNPAVEDQAIDRSYRIGQDKRVIAIRLICRNTVEEKIQQLQQTKAKLASDLVKEGNGFLQSMTKGDWLGLLQNPSP